MEINCSYCENCDTLWDNKDLDADGLCFDCQSPTIAMVARPTKAAQQSVQRTCASCGAIEMFSDDVCIECGASR